MFLTQKNAIRGLSVQEFNALCRLYRLSKNLFDVGLDVVQQYYSAQCLHLAYDSVYHQVKSNESYELLSNDIAQQTLEVVGRAFKSFVKFTEAVRDCLYFQKVNMPYYLLQRGYFMLMMPQIKVKDGFCDRSMSPMFRKKYGEFRIPFPERLVGKTVQEVRIIPRYEVQFFEVEFIIEEKLTPAHLYSDKTLSISPGQDKLATYIDTNGAFLIKDAKSLKLINQWFNEESARRPSIEDKHRYQHLTKRQSTLGKSQNNRVRDYLYKTVRYLINHCWTHQIGRLVISCKLDWKQDINLITQNNQTFVQMPHSALFMRIARVRQIYSKKVTTIWISKEWLGGF